MDGEQSVVSSINGKENRRSIYSTSNLSRSTTNNNNNDKSKSRIVSTTFGTNSPTSFENIQNSDRLSSKLSSLSIDYSMISTPRKNKGDDYTKSEAESLSDVISLGDDNKESNEEDEYGIDEAELSSNDIPKLRDDMTPWKRASPVKDVGNNSSVQRNPNGVIDRTTSSPLTKKHFANSLFQFKHIDEEETDDHKQQSISPQEFEHLKRQLTTYRIRNNTLYEIIKHANLSSNAKENGDHAKPDLRNSFYDKLLNTIKQDDEINDLKSQISNLTNKVEEKDSRIRQLENQAHESKDEYVKTLSYAEEYIKHSDSMSQIVDQILSFIIDIKFKFFNLSEDERDILKKARDIGSNFIMIKLNALDSTVKNLLISLQHNELELVESKEGEIDHGSEVVSNSSEVIANSTQLESHETTAVKDTTVIDSNLEYIVQDLHKEYENFMKSIRNKLIKSANLENLLSQKLSKQERLLSVIGEKTKSQSSRLYRSETTVSQEEDINELNSMVRNLQMSLNDRDIEIVKLQDIIEDTKDVNQEKKKLMREFNDLRELGKYKEENWSNLTNQLEVQSNELNDKNKELEIMLSRQENEMRQLEEVNDVLTNENENAKSQSQHDLQRIEQLQSKNDDIQTLLLKQKNIQSNKIGQSELEYRKFNQSLLLHLQNIFQILEKIIEKTSINQTLRKIDKLNGLCELNDLVLIQPKFEALYNFIEMALESIIESYTNILIEQQADANTSDSIGKRSSNESEFKVNELQRRWMAERERRKLDSNAAEGRISKLEMENELLKDQLFNVSLRN